MTRFLKGEGDGQPVPEPTIKTEDPETLRCYPGESRPNDYVTLPKFAAAEAAKLLADRKLASTPELRQQGRGKLAAVLATDKAVGGRIELKVKTMGDVRHLSFQSEPGMRLTAFQTPAESPPRAKLALVLDWAGSDAAAASETAKALHAAGWTLVTVDLRATGKLAVRGDTIGAAPDHNSAEWSLWIGRPLLGQWVHDVRRTLDAVQAVDGALPPQVAVVGNGPMGLVALAAAALDERIHLTVCVGTLGSFVSDVPYQKQLIGVLAPGIVRDVGDVKHIAALSTRTTFMVAPVRGNGTPMTGDEMNLQFSDVTSVRLVPADRLVEELRPR